MKLLNRHFVKKLLLTKPKNKLIYTQPIYITSAKLVSGGSTGKIGDDPKVETENVTADLGS
ncbi:hypothetical protein EXT48_16110 [Pseudoalteromonas sp. CO348]|uniref:Uncharacterized protein n=2 Tax=Pseudoalteromonas TaxID=53246 RepID=A0A8I2H7P3_9GAMM|nr:MULTISPECIES: hypothetical protein [Pseudoalteromonas]KJY86665.1 hypothetical protein TW75_16535 [Pseudoalteromonas piscicida]MCF2825759.1 hypothetical protein [Pseudoalteromonas sp. OF5H-5]MCF2831057.1 hypothetical protein [Pseudoalteromonas sp. DL2-H6]MCF2923681.1 hypothetical protein [Pseudoalteromonas sp. DL2-H1]NLR21691.1 hypothetical protein [Pseudoalteromonas maricaloris]